MKFVNLITATAMFLLAHASPLAEVATQAVEFTGGLDITLLDEHDGSTNLTKRASTGTIQMWSGNSCDGAAGGIVSLDNIYTKCIDAPNRHSFRAQGCRITQKFAIDKNCNGQYTGGDFEPGVCYNVNTGKPWASSYVRCAQ